MLVARHLFYCEGVRETALSGARVVKIPGANQNVISKIRPKPIGQEFCQLGIIGGDFTAVTEQPARWRRAA
jgi:hypothetical protein